VGVPANKNRPDDDEATHARMNTEDSEMNASNSDATFHNAGSIWLFYPKTPAAQSWLDEHCASGPDNQYSGHALVVEAR
jgi:hypothetical protein